MISTTVFSAATAYVAGRDAGTTVIVASPPTPPGEVWIRGSHQTYDCPPPTPTLEVADPPWYVGFPVRFTLRPSPCLEGWTLDFGDGSVRIEPNATIVDHVYARKGHYEVLAHANYPRNVTAELRISFFIDAFHPPDDEPSESRRFQTYLEAPIYSNANISYFWYLDNGFDWYNRPYSQLSFNAWKKGMANATYLHGQGGVTLHVLPLFDSRPFTEFSPAAHAWIMKTQSNPSNEIPPCQSGYQAPLTAYRTTDLSPTLPSGWGFRSEVMGCGHDLFVPGATELGFCIEWDGEVAPPMTPYLDGYLYDECDLLMDKKI